MWSEALARAAAMDAADPLRHFRARFHLPVAEAGSEPVYACGHSLGLQPTQAAEYVQAELDAWRRLGVKGHFEGDRPWAFYQGPMRDQLAALTGAAPLEVAVMNSLTINLHLLLVSFYRPTPGRFRVVMERDAFPSDRFAVESQVRMHGFDPADAIVEISGAAGALLIEPDDIARALESVGESVALVLLPGVQYYTGQVLDLAAIATIVHAHGCPLAVDLAHAIGNVPLRLHDWNIDFAVWCTYKYLNSGPGGIGGAFVHERHTQAAVEQRLAGWWGQRFEKRFQMNMPLDPSDGADGWQVSNPPILLMAALRAALDLFDEAGFEALHRKTLRLQSFFDELCDSLPGAPMPRISPRNPDARGAQISIDTGASGIAVYDRLTALGVVCDWRPPGALRLSFAPLYNSFSDVCRCVRSLAACLAAR